MPFDYENPDNVRMLEETLKREAANKGVTYDPSDVQGIIRNSSYDRNAGRDVNDYINQALVRYDERAHNKPNDGDSRDTPAQNWNSFRVSDGYQGGPLPSWYQGMVPPILGQIGASQAQATDRQNSLYNLLNQRATQSLAVNAQDPTVRAQVDPFRAEQDRAARNLVSDAAERGGPLGNIDTTRRMAAERAGQLTGNFQSEVLGRELGARRDEIAQALALQGSMLSQDQQRALTSQLALLDQAIKEANVGLGQQGINLQGELGRGELSLRQQQLQQQNDQFLRELALRAWNAGDESNYRWATL